jgi:hypothetical protein
MRGYRRVLRRLIATITDGDFSPNDVGSSLCSLTRNLLCRAAAMNRFLAVCLLIVSAVLAGCASHPSPELRPYSAEETKQLALEALSRRGLSFDEYQQQRAALTGQPQKSFGFDRQGEMNAERDVVLHGRPS